MKYEPNILEDVLNDLNTNGAIWNSKYLRTYADEICSSSSLDTIVVIPDIYTFRIDTTKENINWNTITYNHPIYQQFIQNIINIICYYANLYKTSNIGLSGIGITGGKLLEISSLISKSLNQTSLLNYTKVNNDMLSNDELEDNVFNEMLDVVISDEQSDKIHKTMETIKNIALVHGYNESTLHNMNLSSSNISDILGQSLANISGYSNNSDYIEDVDVLGGYTGNNTNSNNVLFQQSKFNRGMYSLLALLFIIVCIY
jgi:hypothetical protein